MEIRKIPIIGYFIRGCEYIGEQVTKGSSTSLPPNDLPQEEDNGLTPEDEKIPAEKDDHFQDFNEDNIVRFLDPEGRVVIREIEDAVPDKIREFIKHEHPQK